MASDDSALLVRSGRALLDGSRYLTLATADGAGRPWVSPVWFAHRGYREFFWASKPGARHSQNLNRRPEASFVVYDSTVLPADAQAIYVSVLAGEVTPAELPRALAAYTARSVAAGMPEWNVGQVTGSARHRMYRAHPVECWVLGDRDDRIPVDLE